MSFLGLDGGDFKHSRPVQGSLDRNRCVMGRKYCNRNKTETAREKREKIERKRKKLENCCSYKNEREKEKKKKKGNYQSKMLQYFGNMRHNSASTDTFLPRL